MVAARLAVRQSINPIKMRKAAHATMGHEPLTIRARIALMAALGLALFALGPRADAQTTASIPTAKIPTAKSDGGKAADPKSKDAYAKDTKSKDAKSKDKSSKDAKSKDAKGKDAKSKNAKSDPKATTPTVPYNGPASAADVARVKTAVGLARQG